MPVALPSKVIDLSNDLSIIPEPAHSEPIDLSDELEAVPEPSKNVSKETKTAEKSGALERIRRNPLYRFGKRVLSANVAPAGHEEWGVNPYFLGAGSAIGLLAAPELTIPALAAGALSGAIEDAFYQELANGAANVIGGLAPNHPWARFIGGIAAPLLFHHGELGRNADTFFARLAGRGVKGASRELDQALAEAGAQTEKEAGEIVPAPGAENIAQPKPAPAPSAPAVKTETAARIKPVPDVSKTPAEAAKLETRRPAPTDGELVEAERFPGTMVTTVRAGDLGVDPDRFQYKLGTSPAGTRGELSGVKKWDNGLAGILTAWRDRNGRLWVVNGHHRLELAKKLSGPDTRLRVQILDEGPTPDSATMPGMKEITPAMARGYGALVNIAEGRGNELDAAKLLRDEGFDLDEMGRRGLALKSATVDRARAIAGLDAPLFQAAVSGKLKPQAAAILGRELGGNPDAQNAIFKWMESHPGVKSQQIENMARLAANMKNRPGELDLFGRGAFEATLIPEQARIISHIENRLASALSPLGKQAKAAQAAGMDEAAAATAAQQRRALDLFHREAFSAATPISEIARRHAWDLSAAGTPAKRAAIINKAYRESLNSLHERTAEPGVKPPKPPPEMTLGAGMVPPQAVVAAARGVERLREGVETLKRNTIDDLVPQRLPRGEFAARHLTMRVSQALERERLGHKALDGVTAVLSNLGPADLDEFNTLADTRNLKRLGEINPLWEKSARLMNAMIDGKSEILTRLGKRYGKNILRSYYDDYFPRQFRLPTDEPTREAALGRWRQIIARKDWLKDRKLRSYREARMLGLEPKYTNPALLVRDTLDDMDRYIAQLQLLHEDLMPAQLARFFRAPIPLLDNPALQGELFRIHLKPPPKPPQGWRRLEFVRAPHGAYWAPREVAQVINRYLAPGLNRNPAYRGIRALNGGFNAVQLGLSFYHYISESIAAVSHEMSRALLALSRGRPIKALRLAAGSPIAPVKMIRLGNALKRFADDPAFASTHPEYAGLYRHWIGAGGGFAENEEFAARFSHDFTEQLKSVPVAGPIADNFLKSLDLMARPLFKYMVPNLKRAAFAENLEDFIGANPGASDDRIMREAYTIGKEVDDRFGMYNYDRLHLPHTLRDLLFIATRAPGWTLGNLRQMAYGARDIPASLKGITRGTGMSRNTAFMMGTVGTYGLASALFNYAKTGRFPNFAQAYREGGLRGAMARLFGYDSGRTGPDGRPILDMLPGFPRDYASLLFRVGLPAIEGGDIAAPLYGAGKIAAAKVSPVAGLLRDLITNKDYYGNEISNPNASRSRQIAQRLLLHPAAELLPFSFQMYRRQMNDSRAPSKLEAALGAQPMPKEYGLTTLERALLADHERGRTPQQIARGAARAAVFAAAARGDPKALRQALRSGEISMRDVHGQIKAAHLYKQSPLREKLLKASLNNLLDKEEIVSTAQLPLYYAVLRQKALQALHSRTLTLSQRKRYDAVIKRVRERLGKGAKAA